MKTIKTAATITLITGFFILGLLWVASLSPEQIANLFNAMIG